MGLTHKPVTIVYLIDKKKRKDGLHSPGDKNVNINRQREDRKGFLENTRHTLPLLCCLMSSDVD